MYELRPYQTAAIEAVESGWRGVNGEPPATKQLIAMPTGCGKTIIFAHIARHEVESGRRVCILAHREELLDQAQAKLYEAADLTTALEKGKSTAHDALEPVVVASVQTFHSRRLERWHPNAFDLIVVDEAHHSLADTYLNVFEHFTGARLLGVTATPDRGDRKSLGLVYDRIAYEYSLRQAIKDGWLCPIKAKLLPLKIDITNVRTVHGDYSANDLDVSIAPYLEEAARAIAEHAADRKVLVFVPLVRTSEAFAAICRNYGLRAQHIDGQSDNRKEILQNFAKGEYQVLTNSSLLLEGYDCPDIDCLVVLRPTQSRPLYAQMVGRGTRIAPGKKDLLLLDFLWQSTKHNLCVPTSLFSKSQDGAKQAMDYIEPGGKEKDLLDVESDAQAARERSLRQQLDAQRHKKRREMNPIEFALSIHDDDLAEYEPTMAWEFDKPTDKQLRVVANFGIDPGLVTCKGHASVIIGKVLGRREAGLCTPKQARVLGKYGIDASRISFERASEIIDEISKSWGAPGRK